jgi:RimJ/RimL family protein N-acetyltransferase
MAPSAVIPYRIEVANGPVIRCWEPRDAALLKDAVDSSLEHLREWMPWAYDEPQEIDEKVALPRLFRGRFDPGQGIFAADESKALGGTGLHPRVGDGAFEIGYWIRASHVGGGGSRRP